MQQQLQATPAFPEKLRHQGVGGVHRVGLQATGFPTAKIAATAVGYAG